MIGQVHDQPDLTLKQALLEWEVGLDDLKIPYGFVRNSDFLGQRAGKSLMGRAKISVWHNSEENHDLFHLTESLKLALFCVDNDPALKNFRFNPVSAIFLFEYEKRFQHRK